MCAGIQRSSMIVSNVGHFFCQMVLVSCQGVSGVMWTAAYLFASPLICAGPHMVKGHQWMQAMVQQPTRPTASQQSLV